MYVLFDDNVEFEKGQSPNVYYPLWLALDSINAFGFDLVVESIHI